jgi:TRAP-type uncharacterized transport system fused permease subunit
MSKKSVERKLKSLERMGWFYLLMTVVVISCLVLSVFADEQLTAIHLMVIAIFGELICMGIDKRRDELSFEIKDQLRELQENLKFKE